MNVLIDGLSIFHKYNKEILVFFIVVMGLGLFSLKHILSHELNLEIRLLAAFGVGSAALCVVTYALIILSYFWPYILRPGSYTIIIFSVLVLVREVRLKKINTVSGIRIVFGTIILFLLLIIRLAFLNRIILPPYSDSPVHYQIVFDLLHPDALNNSKLSLENILINYYHLGFHSLVAWLTSVTKVDPLTAISLLGQLFLVIGPISVVFLVYSLSNNIVGAVFAGFLAAIGWHMPAFSANWGKYPALVALATAPSVIAFFRLRTSFFANNKTNLFLGILLLIGTALMHTRVVVCLLLTAVCFFLSAKLKIENELGFLQSIGYSFLYVISLWPLLNLLIDFYSGILLLAVMFILLPPAFMLFPRLSVGVFLFTSGAWLTVIVPSLFNNSFLPLLDKQFLEMMLYIPFSVMGGAGLTGVITKISFSGKLRWVVIIPFFVFVFLNFLQHNSIYPDPCCDYFNENDRLAFKWLKERNSEKTLVLISTQNNRNGQIIGTDAGIWLFPLIGQPTNKLPFDINWNESNEIKEICQLGIREVFIYEGGRQHSFDASQLSSEEWVKLVFFSGKTRIYQISGCNNE